jgi:hypothetical protein
MTAGRNHMGSWTLVAQQGNGPAQLRVHPRRL